MEIAAIVLAVLSMGLSVFILLKASSNNHILNARIERLKDKIHKLEYRLNDAKGPANKGNRPDRGQQEQPSEQRKKGQPPQPKQPKQQPNEQQQKRQQPNEQQQRRRQPDEQQEQQAPQQPRRQQSLEAQDQQAPQQQRRQPSPEQPERRRRQPLDAQDQNAPQQQPSPEQQDEQTPQQPRRRKENRRREPREDMQREEVNLEQPEARDLSLDIDLVGRDLLAQMDQFEEAGGKKYAIIPEDGVIRGHQLQQRPDSDSYLEVDVPAENSSTTNYRFNLAGNHEFVIAQGIDRLENAFDFEKPSNRKVSQVVLQSDGILAKVNNGWRIQEKARIDFR